MPILRKERKQQIDGTLLGKVYQSWELVRKYVHQEIQYFALRLAVRETGLPPPPIPHQNPRLAPRTVYQHAQTDFSIFGPCWPCIYIDLVYKPFDNN